MTHIDLQTILTTWEGDAGAIVLCAVLVALAVAYGLACRRRSPRGRRWAAGPHAIVRLLDDPAFAMLSGPRAPLMLTLDYYLTMYVYQLTPLRTWSEQSTWVHFVVHQYFLFCGLFFWWPVVAADPARLRLSASAKRVMVWLGLPAFGLLGVIELAAGSATTGLAYLVSGAVLTLAGAAVVAFRTRGAGAFLRAASSRSHSLSGGSVSGVGGPG